MGVSEEIRRAIEELGFTIKPGTHPVVPVMLFDAPLAQQFARRLYELGVLATGVALGWLGAAGVSAVMWLVAALLAYTLVNRVRQGLKEQQSLPSA